MVTLCRSVFFDKKSQNCYKCQTIREALFSSLTNITEVRLCDRAHPHQRPARQPEELGGVRRRRSGRLGLSEEEEEEEEEVDDWPDLDFRESVKTLPDQSR